MFFEIAQKSKNSKIGKMSNCFAPDWVLEKIMIWLENKWS